MMHPSKPPAIDIVKDCKKPFKICKTLPSINQKFDRVTFEKNLAIMSSTPI